LALVDSYASKTSKELVIFQLNRSSCISVKNKLNTVLSSHDSDQYTMSVKPNLISYNNPKTFVKPFNSVHTNGIRFIALSRAKKIPELMTKPLTHLLVSENSIPARSFLDKARPKVIIADGSNSYAAVRKLERLCEEYHIQFHSTRDKGAFVLPL
jgi:hypothetical protein